MTDLGLNIIKSMKRSNVIKEGEWFCAVRLVDKTAIYQPSFSIIVL